MLLSSLLFAIPGLESKITSSGVCVLEPPLDGRPKEVGLLALTREALIYYVDYEMTLLFPWTDITKVRGKKKLVGRRLTLDLADGRSLTFRVDTGRLALEIEAACLSGHG
jgi:hypothetical protein